MYSASSDSRNRTRRATSCGSPRRCIGIFDKYDSRAPGAETAGKNIGVSMKPGQTAFTRIRSDPSACARERVKPITPCFDAVYAGIAPCPISPSIERDAHDGRPRLRVTQSREERPHEGGFRPQVDLEDGVEPGRVEGIRGRHHRDPRGVHEPPDTTERGDGGLDARVDRVDIAHVEFMERGLHTELGGALVGDGLGARAVEVPRRHRATDLGEGAAHFPPDARGSPVTTTGVPGRPNRSPLVVMLPPVAGACSMGRSLRAGIPGPRPFAS